MRFGLPVAPDEQHVETGDDAFAAPIHIRGREIAQDATPDLLALGAHAQCLGDLEHAVRAHADVALPQQDAFVGTGDRDRRRQRQQQQPGAPHQGSNSKYSAGAKPNTRATTRSGIVAMRVFRLFTAPL